MRRGNEENKMEHTEILQLYVKNITTRDAIFNKGSLKWQFVKYIWNIGSYTIKSFYKILNEYKEATA